MNRAAGCDPLANSPRGELIDRGDLGHHVRHDKQTFFSLDWNSSQSELTSRRSARDAALARSRQSATLSANLTISRR
jgi:hypothetical protein